MLTNSDMTIFNTWFNPATKRSEYHSTILEGIWWYGDQKIVANDKGAVSADIYKIRIPDCVYTAGKRYLPYDEYQNLSATEIYRFWTINKGDLFASGKIKESITKLSDLTLKYTLSGKVMSFSDNRSGLQPHFRIGGIA